MNLNVIVEFLFAVTLTQTAPIFHHFGNQDPNGQKPGGGLLTNIASGVLGLVRTTEEKISNIGRNIKLKLTGGKDPAYNEGSANPYGQNQGGQTYNPGGGQAYNPGYSGQGYYPGNYPGGQTYPVQGYGNYPTQPGSYPGSGYPGSGQSGYPGTNQQGMYPGGQSGYPGSGTQGYPNYPGSGNQGYPSYPGSGAQGSYPGYGGVTTSPGGQNLPGYPGYGQNNQGAIGQGAHPIPSSYPGTTLQGTVSGSSSQGTFGQNRGQSNIPPPDKSIISGNVEESSYPGQNIFPGRESNGASVTPVNSGQSNSAGEQKGFPSTFGEGYSQNNGGQSSITGTFNVPQQGVPGTSLGIEGQNSGSSVSSGTIGGVKSETGNKDKLVFSSVTEATIEPEFSFDLRNART